jgi:NodT family efflux transporter outer membrane factor (OMF) lipoprotein
MLRILLLSLLLLCPMWQGRRRSRMNYNKFSGLLLIVLFLASGCVKVGPDFVKPEADTMPQWLEASGYKQLTTKADDYRDWWRSFNDPVLDNLIQTTYQQNLNLRIAGVRVLAARAQLGAAVGELYPQSQFGSGSLLKTRLSQTGPTSLPGIPENYSVSQIGLSASWELDFWGKFRRAVESADASLMAAVADYDNALVSLTGDVANSYIQTRTLEKRLAIAHQNVEVQKRSLEIATARWRGGTTSKRDVEQALTVLQGTEASIPTLESQWRQAQNALSVLLGMPPSDLKHLLGSKSEIPTPPPQVAVGIPADLLRRRPDIRSTEWQAAAQCAQIGVAKANLYPAFSLVGTFGLQASDIPPFVLSNMFDWRSRTGFMGPSFQWNLFNYGQITNQVRFQDARFQELLITYQQTVLQAQQEVENALIGFLKAQQRAQKLVGATGSAQSSVNLATLQYRQGITDFTTVLTAEQNLLTYQDSLANTLGDISSNLVAMYRAMGGGWQLREGQDVVPDSVKEAMAKRTNWGKLLTPVALPPPEQPKSDIRLPQW